MTTSIRAKLLVLLLAFGLVAAACSDDSDPVSSGDADTTEQTDDTTAADDTTDDDDEATTDDGETEAGDDALEIVSLSPTATEMLFAIGAGDLVVAADDFSNYPPEAPTTDLSGFEPNVEAIAAYDPDVVVASFISEDIIGGLEAVGIQVEVYPAAVTLEDAYTQLKGLGDLTGTADAADALVTEIRDELDELAAEVPVGDEPLTYYYELDNSFYSVTSSTFIGEIMALAGLENIADAADESGSGYPQLTEEFIIGADPDVILNACSKFCDTSAESISARPGWDTISAVQTGRVIDLDDDIASRWGPRIVDLFTTVTEGITAA